MNIIETLIIAGIAEFQDRIARQDIVGLKPASDYELKLVRLGDRIITSAGVEADDFGPYESLFGWTVKKGTAAEIGMESFLD